MISAFDNSGITFKLYVDGFNKYAKENNIDIDLKMHLLTAYNFSITLENSNMMYESLLKKKRSKYDIYFYDSSWTQKFCPYFIDLRQYLEEEHINMYNKDIVSKTCLCQNSLIGLPLVLNYDGLYSNKFLLQKYNKTVPKTWNELLETGKEILEKERALNNTELIGYNGLFFNSEMGFLSIYEFIHSSREKIESPFPDITSKEALEATKLLKKIKEEISS
eukprot:jgi/Orpsp1_1/1184681/evm.model.c7180000090536.1